MTKKELELELQNLKVKDKIDSLESLLKHTLSVNEKFNLTAIKDEKKFRELMILDSLLPLNLINFNDKKVIDIGTGAGYPGLPLAITTHGEFTLLDSTSKKINQINEFVSNLKLDNVKTVSARAEEYVLSHREEFDIGIARAVSSLNILLEIGLPLIKEGGYFIAMKGPKGKEEIEEASNALKELGGEVVEINEVALPESNEVRVNILIKKIKKTPKKYPRVYKDISNKPL